MSYNLEKLKQELIRDEGKRTVAYMDTKKNWTIGIGHLLSKKELKEYLDKDGSPSPIPAGDYQIDRWFTQDIESAEKIIDKMFPFWKELDEVRQRALLNLAFNLGNRLWNFIAFIRYVGDRNWLAAGKELKKSNWWKDVKERGPRIRKMIETGKTE